MNLFWPSIFEKEQLACEKDTKNVYDRHLGFIQT